MTIALSVLIDIIIIYMMKRREKENWNLEIKVVLKV